MIDQPNPTPTRGLAVPPPHGAERVIVEAVAPEIDAGRFPVKRTVGESVMVEATIFADGHDRLAAVVRHRQVAQGPDAAGPPREWRETPMTLVENDRWRGRFAVTEIGAYEYTIEAWVDHFASWVRDLKKRVDAGQNVTTELEEGAALVRAAADRATASVREAAVLRGHAERLVSSGRLPERVAVALDPAILAMVSRYPDRRYQTSYARVLRVVVDRGRARFGAWYEMFPRSAGPDPTRSATFAEAAVRLPEIADMGFDVLYLPPIHPIGVTHRKGKRNTLTALPGDPGSPWAIGSADGGHMAVEPGLGTLADFDAFQKTARRHGLEIALDIAFQCSPDHPDVKAHPEWFRHRPDGSIKFAENPPKKYQDIVPLNFESEAWQELWLELRRVVLFWVSRGVKIFRVDNPHTKSFHFWEWLIADVRSRHPDTIFLAEAFTRPAVMRYLAKAGFTQSYSYFTWRNTREELTEYFTELTTTDVREYMRPNLFANTPDILHAYLQEGGRAAFQVRFVLAATLGATYGIYSGFELSENAAVPGTEEYLDSEKYQVRHRDWNQPGHIKELISRVNRIRRENAALQSDWSLAICETDNASLFAYAKSTPDHANVILVVVNLDPRGMQHGWVRVPLSSFDRAPDASYIVHDLVTDARYRWRGEWNYVRLDPDVLPFHLFRVEAA